VFSDRFNSKSIVIAIAQRDITPWREIRSLGQEETWVLRFREAGIRVIYYLSNEPNWYQDRINQFREYCRFKKNLGKWQGRFDKYYSRLTSFKEPDFQYFEDSHELLVSSPSTMHRMHERNFALFKWFLEKNTSDYLFRTNTSSYLNELALTSYLDSVSNRDNFLGGVLIAEAKNSFVSGAGILLPRQTVEYLVENWSLLERNVIEDVALSKLARRINIPLIDLPRLDYSSPNSAYQPGLDQLRTNFHFRCKGSSRPSDDIEIMKLLDSRIH
jgi:hypothetical protein